MPPRNKSQGSGGFNGDDSQGDDFTQPDVKLKIKDVGNDPNEGVGIGSQKGSEE